MATHFHAVVWLDHHEARIVYFNLTAADETIVHPEHEPRHIHAKAGSASGTHLQGNPHYFAEVAAALAPAGAILILGPSTAKGEFATYLRDHAPPVAAKVAGVETADKMTDPQLIAFARRRFVAGDRMMPQSTRPV